MTTTPPRTAAPPPSHPAHILLTRAHTPDTATRIFTDKVVHKPLHLRPTTNTDKRALRRHIRLHKQRYRLAHQKPQPLSAKQKRELGVHDIRKQDVSHDVYRGLNSLWNGYMLEVLGFTRDGKLIDGWEKREVSAAQQGSLLAAADFHGAEVEVVRCRDVGKVGFKGVLVRDTKFTFVIVMEGDKVRTVMKRGAVFRYEVRVGEGVEGKQARRVVLEVNGDALEFRPVDRAGRKFKWHNFDV